MWHHAIAQAAATLCLAAGVLAVYLNKERLGKKHLHTTHAQVSAAFIVVFVLQLGVSAVLLWPARSAREREPWRFVHTVAGVATMALGLVALGLGWYSKNIQKAMAGLMGGDAGLLNGLAIGGVLAMMVAYGLHWTRRR